MCEILLLREKRHADIMNAALTVIRQIIGTENWLDKIIPAEKKSVT